MSSGEHDSMDAKSMGAKRTLRDLPPTLTERIDTAPHEGHEIVFLSRSSFDRVPMDRFVAEARESAARLQALGVEPGDKVAILGTTSRPVVQAIVGTWLAGATTIVLPLPMRLGSVDAFVEATRRRVRVAEPRLVVVSEEFAGIADLDAGDIELRRLSEVVSGPAPQYERPPVKPESMAVLQFSSGSTGDPRGVIVTHAMICANLDGAAAVAELHEDDRLMSWLPLYHDMGLIGLLSSAMMYAIDIVIGAPQDFLLRPAAWLEAISEFRATISAAPNSAYALAAKVLARQGTAFDLSSWRIALNGAEPVDPDVVDRFVEAGKSAGLDPGAPFCAYGLAEATIAATFPEPGTGMAVDVVDVEALELESRALPARPGSGRDSRRLAKLGRPVPSVELRIVDNRGYEVGERTVGEIELRGPAITPGYYNDPEGTAAAFHDGWLKTGDLGYLADGELVVCGRKKDIIIVAGRNLYPQDIERLVETVPGVRPGNTVAFPVQTGTGREGFAIVAETKEADRAHEIAKEAAKAVREFFGMAPVHLAMVPAGALPKTSSGKLQRSLTKSLFEQNRFEVLAST
jgi:fatty-acyl-CoA synthase